MARLPQPGGDNGNWGLILNDYLSQVHKADGTIKDNAVTNSAIAPDAVTSTEIADGTILEAQLSTSVQSKLNQTAPTWATITGRPAIVAAGDDTAAAKSILSLTKSDVGLNNVDNTSDLNKPIATAVQAALDTKFDATTMSFTRTSSLPSEMGWPSAHPLTPTIVENLKGEMYGSCGYTAEQFFDRFSTARSAPSVVYYVNRQSGVGSDSNNGLSSTSPFQTIKKAITSANTGGVPATVYVEYNEYNRTVGFQDTSPTVDIAFIATDGNVPGGSVMQGRYMGQCDRFYH